MMEYYKLGINNGFFEKSLRYPLFWYESCTIVEMAMTRKEDGRCRRSKRS